MNADVVILGGGLAGLTLSLQLRQRFADLDILVLERRRHPVPEAAHKVGESTVEIAANYFDTVLGLEEHLTQRQLKKFGFRFFFSEGRRDIDGVLELGVSTGLATPAYQIDRGIFRDLPRPACARRRRPVPRRVTVREVGRGEDGTACAARWAASRFAVQARWLVDVRPRRRLKSGTGLARTSITM
jgi:2-polyprenyl-6-methoxyphenol hydroxylase-like FAD-dependent oxidoreductase